MFTKNLPSLEFNSTSYFTIIIKKLEQFFLCISKRGQYALFIHKNNFFGSFIFSTHLLLLPHCRVDFTSYFTVDKIDVISSATSFPDSRLRNVSCSPWQNCICTFPVHQSCNPQSTGKKSHVTGSDFILNKCMSPVKYKTNNQVQKMTKYEFYFHSMNIYQLCKNKSSRQEQMIL